MSHSETWDIIVLVSNDLTHDERIHRLCSFLSDNAWNTLLIGREKRDSVDIEPKSYNQKRVTVSPSSGPLFYWNLIKQQAKYINSQSYKRILCVDEDTLGVLSFIDTDDSEVYFDAHELFTGVPELIRKPFKKWIWDTWAKKMIKKVDTCITVNNKLAEALEEKYEKSFHVIRNVPEVEISDVPENEMENEVLRLVYLGVLNKGRGLEEIIRVVKNNPKYRLTIIGDGDIGESLHSLSSKSDNIKFAGNLIRENYKFILKSSHVGINLLDLRSKSYRLSLANKVFNYAAAGLPTLCIKTSIYEAYHLRYNCFQLVQDLSENTLEVALDELTKERVKELSMGTKKMISECNWESEQKRVAEIFKL